jgi:hypothetical protein
MSQAEQWAAKNFGKEAQVVRFRVATKDLEGLKTLSFNETSASWQRFARHNRLGGRMHGYDVVEGPMVRNVRSFAQAGPAVPIGHQTSWHTQDAVDILNRGLQP